MGTPNIWMLGVALRWTIFEFSNIRILGTRGTYLPPNFNSLIPTLLAQVLREGRLGAQGENPPWPNFLQKEWLTKVFEECLAQSFEKCSTTFAKGSVQPILQGYVRPLLQGYAQPLLQREVLGHLFQKTPQPLKIFS
ncbi:hypothetical protein L3X38_042396 [Prunus dulcis]|uniref:Uncharacterized protein n=1 Tax=Prunus dulcis TaxID=3755 RepID=A0AAD4YKA2_PRUDU|nr:hypothetical protein L3X38_042396 [Prunus dulcis]